MADISNPDVWKTTDASVTTEEIDQAIHMMRIAQNIYDEKKEESNRAHANLQEVKEKVIKLLDRANKTNYAVKDLGKVTLVRALKVTTPKSLEDRADLFKYLSDTLGRDGFLTYASVNYNSLNSLYKTMLEQAPDKANFKMPGVGEPTEELQIRFSKK